MAIFSAIVGAFSAVAAVVTKAFSAVIPALKIVEAVISVAKVLVSVGKSFGIIDGVEEKPSELGDQILQAEENGVTANSCSSFEEYKAKVKNQRLDKEKSLKTTNLEKLSAATGYYVKSIENETNFDFGKEYKLLPYIAKNQSFFTPDRLKSIITGFKETNYSADDIAKYFDKKSLNIEDSIKIEDKLVEIEKKNDSNFESSKFYEELENINNI